MNVDRLLKICEVITEEPRRLNMAHWGCINYVNNLESDPPCGTVGCIAGWAVMLFDEPAKKKIQDYQGGTAKTVESLLPNRFINLIGQELLDLTHKQGEALFYIDFWPKLYRVQYYEAYLSNPQECVDATVARIKHMIATGD